jgi:hypothetical protein
MAAIEKARVCAAFAPKTARAPFPPSVGPPPDICHIGKKFMLIEHKSLEDVLKEVEGLRADLSTGVADLPNVTDNRLQRREVARQRLKT